PMLIIGCWRRKSMRSHERGSLGVSAKMYVRSMRFVLRNLPPFPIPNRPVLRDGHISRREFFDVLETAARRGDVAVGQRFVDGDGVDLGRDAEREEGFGFA